MELRRGPTRAVWGRSSTASPCTQCLVQAWHRAGAEKQMLVPGLPLLLWAMGVRAPEETWEPVAENVRRGPQDSRLGKEPGEGQSIPVKPPPPYSPAPPPTRLPPAPHPCLALLLRQNCQSPGPPETSLQCQQRSCTPLIKLEEDPGPWVLLFSRKHLKNAGRQRSSRSGYLLPLVLLRNSSADYTALSSTTPALCPGLWEGSSAPPPRLGGSSCRGKHIWRELFPTRFKNTSRATFS